MSFCFSRLTISSMISPSPLTSLQDSRGEKDHQFNQGGGILPPNSHSCGTLSPAYLVLPVSGSTTLRITLCLASYSSLVRGLLVDSRAFCSSVMTGEAKMHQRGGNNQITISEWISELMGLHILWVNKGKGAFLRELELPHTVLKHAWWF